MTINKEMMIAEAIQLDEGIADILMQAGMGCIGCAMAHGENIEQACAVHGVDADVLIQKINDYLASK